MFLVDPALSDGAIATVRMAYFYRAWLLLFWLQEMQLPSIARKGFLIFIAISGTFITINNICGVLTGIGNNNGWGGIILTAIISIWGIILLLKEKVNEV